MTGYVATMVANVAPLNVVLICYNCFMSFGNPTPFRQLNKIPVFNGFLTNRNRWSLNTALPFNRLLYRPKALPNAVSNCTIFNRTELNVDIQCIPGYDGGLPQVFVLEMFSIRTGITRYVSRTLHKITSNNFYIKSSCNQFFTHN